MVFLATARKRTLARPEGPFRRRERQFHGTPRTTLPAPCPVHPRRATRTVQTARTARNAKVNGRGRSICGIGNVRVRSKPRFAPGASHSSRVAVRLRASLADQNRVFFRKHVLGGGILAILADSRVSKKTGVTASPHGQFHGHKILVQKMATSLQPPS